MKSAKIKPVRPFIAFSSPNREPQFLDWLQGRDRFCLEIGCGAGLHPIQFCKTHPEKNLIAIERTAQKFKSLQQRARNHNLPNLFIVNEDAHDWLPRNLLELKLEELFFLYPNPYPKEKQANKRWYRSPFFHFLLAALKEGGRITTATNEKFLFEECLLYASECWNLQLHSTQPLPAEPPFSPRTHFEKKYLERGETCYEIIFHKKAGSEK